MMDCLFCKIANKEEQADLIYEDKAMIAFKDIEPKAPTHILIIPKQHLASLKETEDAELLGKMMLTAKKIAEQQKAKGYKLVMNVGEQGGQLIEHIHLHLLIGNPKQLP